MSHNIFGLFLQAEKLENLIVPDSVQKEKFAQTVKRLAALDVNDIVSDIVSWLIWTGIKICIALAIYYAGRWFIKRIVNMIDAIVTRRRAERRRRERSAVCLAHSSGVNSACPIRPTLSPRVRRTSP